MVPRSGEVLPVSFADRPCWIEIYDSPAPNKSVAAGRQVGKSLYLASEALVKSAVIPHHRTLYVSPTHMQTKAFSNDRLISVFTWSPNLLAIKGGTAKDSFLHKHFTLTGSEIILRYAYHSADRIRGLFADQIDLDEFQDLLPEVVPVIEQTQHTAREEFRVKRYCGTFKSNENPLTQLHYDESTQEEWIIPCRKSCKQHTHTHWNIVGPNNIGSKGLVCDKCGEPINPFDGSECRWVSTDPNPERKKYFRGFRVPQVICPCDWKEVLWNMRRMPPEKFYNEVLALPYDSGIRPITMEDLRANCSPDITMRWGKTSGWYLDRYMAVGQNQTDLVFAGIDWGSGRQGFTVLCLGTYAGKRKFQFFYYKRYDGIEADPQFIIHNILDTLNKFNVVMVGADYGFGFKLNDDLQRAYGMARVATFEYVNSHQKTSLDPNSGTWKLDRTSVMSDYFNAIRRQDTFLYPRWEDFYDPFGRDHLSVVAEENESIRKLVYTHPRNQPDDSVHASIYCFLASCMRIPRTEFFIPETRQTPYDYGTYEP